jgi:hypothetical protein
VIQARGVHEPVHYDGEKITTVGEYLYLMKYDKSVVQPIGGKNERFF